MSLQRLYPLDDQLAPFPAIELFGIDKTRLIEKNALEQSREADLMAKAGHAVARLTLATYPHANQIWVLAGKGNNGGDAIEAAVRLHNMGKHIYLTWLGSVEHMSADTAKAVAKAEQAGLTLHPYPPTKTDQLQHFIQNVDLIIDGLLGIGLSAQKPLSQELLMLIKAINHNPAPVISIDIPSGLISDTGKVQTDAVRANHTITFLSAKTGLFTADARAYTGEVWLDNLQAHDDGNKIEPDALLFTQQQYRRIARPQNTHKGSFGNAAVVGGATGMTGAAILAARSTLKAGAGKVYLSLLSNADPQSPPLELDPLCPELMLRSWVQLPVESSTIACGCGGGSGIAQALPRLFKLSPRLVIDADALHAIAQSSQLQQLLKDREPAGLQSILTPHPLEAARLLNTTVEKVQVNRLLAAQTLAKQFGVTCILKGSGTVIASISQTPYINSSGNAALATAGSGDVLAGWIAGRWSAYGAPLDHQELHQLSAQCVWEHGHAADQWLAAGHNGVLPASQLIQWLE